MKGASMKSIIKNIDTKQILNLKEIVPIRQHEVVSRTLVQNDHVSMTLFAFDKGEEISTHASQGDAFVYLLEGQASITIDGNKYELKAQDSIVMPATLSHALYAVEGFKMLLVVVFKD